VAHRPEVTNDAAMHLTYTFVSQLFMLRKNNIFVVIVL
jgi:hypothetical protein